jgi:ABC-2 type transport system permease protein
MWRRLKALVKKELLAMLRDPKSRIVLIGPPIIQLFVFSYAATLDVTNVDIAALNRDAGRWGVEFIQRVAGSPVFRAVKPLTGEGDIQRVIDNRDVIAAIQIGPEFSRRIEAGLPAKIQVVLDGRRSNAAQIVQGYLSQIARGLGGDISARAGVAPPGNAIVERFWFNPNLKYIWFTVPNLVGLIAMLIAIVVTGQSVARERELGTHEQLMVSPLRIHEIIVGKTLPPLMIGLFHGTLFISFAVFFFHVPFRGSLFLLYVALVLFLASIIAVGLFVSSLAQTQQQAFLGVFSFAAPAVMLSGFATPIENMPDWLQTITLANPLRHFLVIVKGAFLTGMPAGEILRNAMPLVIIAAVLLVAASAFFRRRVG